MNRPIRSILALGAILAMGLSIAPASRADEVTNKKIQGDINKAIGTLDDMQKLGREIRADHNAAIAGQSNPGRRTGIRPAGVTTAAEKKVAAKKGNGKAGNNKATTGKKANGAKAAKKKPAGS